MKLLQLNLWMGRLTPQILKLIEAEQPDIITAQEVFDCTGPVVFPDNTFDIFGQIKNIGYEHTYFSPTWSMEVAHETAPFGNAVFSKFPIIHQETTFINGEYVEDLTPERRVPNSRNLQTTLLQVGEATLCVINHHGYWEITPEGSETSIEKMKLVVEQAQKHADLPLIFAGDLNLNASAPAMRVFDNFLEDLTATHQVSTTLSVLGKVPNVACDHVLVNDRISVRDFRVCEEIVSDHKALVVEFDLK